MGRIIWVILVLTLFSIVLTYLYYSGRLPMRKKPLPTPTQNSQYETISLPEPQLKGEKSLEETISKRRSRRNFQDKTLSFEQASQILWAGQGITKKDLGFRTAPSAGALYPLDLYLIVGEKSLLRSGTNDYLPAGVYHFLPEKHELENVKSGDLRNAVMEASLNQSFIAQAPVVLIVTAEYERTTQKYGERGKKYVHMEAGHAAQNICLQIESLGLGTVTVGAFEGEKLQNLLNLPSSYQPLYVLPIGYPK